MLQSRLGEINWCCGDQQEKVTPGKLLPLTCEGTGALALWTGDMFCAWGVRWADHPSFLLAGYGSWQWCQPLSLQNSKISLRRWEALGCQTLKETTVSLQHCWTIVYGPLAPHTILRPSCFGVLEALPRSKHHDSQLISEFVTL